MIWFSLKKSETSTWYFGQEMKLVIVVASSLRHFVRGYPQSRAPSRVFRPATPQIARLPQLLPLSSFQFIESFDALGLIA